MFDPVDPKQSFPSLERGIQRYWREEGTFRRSLDQRRHAPVFSFYDGPPFATGLPHYGHLLAGTIKDVIPRYQTMRGKFVERRFGWDCHGLPIENLIEKEHDLKSKRDIDAMGVRAFNDLCRGAVQRYTKEWRTVVERMGRWVDMDHDYRTMDPQFMESIWWVFDTLWQRSLIYEGYKPMHICPRCVTPLSNFEVTQGYSDRTDYSVIVTFPLVDDPTTAILAWTTTPWSLPGNLFLALGPTFSYSRVQCEGMTYIVGTPLIDKLFKGREHTVLGTVAPQDLDGARYVPLFRYFVDAPIPSAQGGKPGETYGSKAFHVVLDERVSIEEGTGIVHFASGYGDDGYDVAQQKGVGVLHHVTLDGQFVPAVTDFHGLEVKPRDGDGMGTDRAIAAHLKAAGRLFWQGTITHSYPHCWRCDSPLLNYATSSWFVRVEQMKDRLLAANGQTEWVPAHLRDGRFGKWLEGARDWAISRSRYWGTPLPIWRNTDTGDTAVIGSRDDLLRAHRIRFTKITALRHGESDGNVQKVYQGALPGSDLTAQGRTQAAAAAAHLTTDDVTVIYCSPHARAQQTAQILADATGARVVVDERLREKSYGDYEGKWVEFSDLSFAKSRRIHQLERATEESLYHLDGMETAAEIDARIAGFLQDVLPQHRGDHVVLVTHADPLYHVRRFFTGEELTKLFQQPAPVFATPESFFYDHARAASLDLHKDTVDTVTWPGSAGEQSVHTVLVRHGETDWNKDGLIQGGNIDRPLNARGRSQAADAADQLKSERFDLIISSDLTRAVETAEIISKRLGIPYQERWDLLRERHMGAWTGQDLATVLKEQPTFHASVGLAMHHATPPEGESLTTFLARAQAAYERLLATYPGKRVLIVSHNGFIQAFRCIAENVPYREVMGMRLQNAELLPIVVRPLLRRIPDVLDCWFESGSMPYAQPHFPFASSARGELPPGFPADFIAEGIDQTRGWFYTLTVLGAALFDRSPFRHCIVNGTVLAEDGRKMSKRLKNYPDPLEVAEKYGADALRFALMSSPAVRAEDLRFSERTVEEALRSIILPLWNAYSFFVTYANAAQFTPSGDRRRSSHPLDQWILAEVQDLVQRMTTQLDAYDLSATCAELHETVDALTNWYIRLSRRRFAGKAGSDAHGKASDAARSDQHAALTTLHDVLLSVCQVLAPFCPFVTDAIYLNLAATPHGSIHLTDWPEPRALSQDERSLIAKNRLMRLIVSLGNTVRADQTIKIRQPLQSATVVLPPAMRGGAVGLTEEDIALLREEMNVLAVHFDEGASVQAIIQVDARKVGPRLGKRVQEVIRAGKEGQLRVDDDGCVRYDDMVLTADEYAVLYRAEEGQGTASERGVVVTLDTRLTPELQEAGRMRDVIRLVQRLRKEAGLEMSDRITLRIDGIADLLAAHGARIAAETNAILGPVEDDVAFHTADLDGASATVRFRKA